MIVLGVGEIYPAKERIGAPKAFEKSNDTSSAVNDPPRAMGNVNASANTYANVSANGNVNTSANAASNANAYSNVNSNPTRNAYPSGGNRYESAVSNQKVNTGGAVVRNNERGMNISPIDSLNPYPGGRWTIKARVTNRAPIKNWSNSRGDGKLFSIELLDAKGGEIRATMFNDSVDKYYEMLQPGKTFYFSGGKVKMANRKYSSINNDYEITFDQHSEINMAPEDTNIKTVNYNFKKIAEIESLPPDTTIDIIGIVKHVGDCAELTSKTGKQLHKRDIVLVDDSSYEVKVTMWNERAQEDCTAYGQNVLAIKGCRISEYNGRSIGTFNSSTFTLNPDLPEAGVLMNWYANGGSGSSVKSLSASSGFGGGGFGEFNDRVTVSDIKNNNLGMGQKPDYITVKGTINYIKHDGNISYQACIKCQKKVIEDVNQNYLCEKCQMTHENCENRYILSCTIQDNTGSAWATCFNDQGKILLENRSADEMVELQQSNAKLFENVFKQCTFKEFIFRLRVKAEQVQEELRVKSSVVSLEPINYISESTHLIDLIAKYNY